MSRTLGILAGVSLLLASCTSQGAPPSTPVWTEEAQGIGAEPAPGGPVGQVVRVVDGDTIDVRVRGRVFTVRLIGVDTPESVHPTVPDECFGRAASAFATEALSGRLVRLEYDVERLDRYGRDLAYVWIGGELFNQTLVSEGYASAYPYPPNTRYEERFAAAEERARAAGLGMWGACDLAPSRAASPPPARPDGACDPAYPGVCIPPPPPDLDCADVDERAFVVRGDDPHHFDGNGNGRGCE